MNKVIVTGGLGFIGSNLIKLLLKKNIMSSILIKQRMLRIFIIPRNLVTIKIINTLN